MNNRYMPYAVLALTLAVLVGILASATIAQVPPNLTVAATNSTILTNSTSSSTTSSSSPTTLNTTTVNTTILTTSTSVNTTVPTTSIVSNSTVSNSTAPQFNATSNSTAPTNESNTTILNNTKNVTNSTVSNESVQAPVPKPAQPAQITISLNQPSSVTLDSNETYTFSVAPPTGGSAPYTYTWYATGLEAVSGCGKDTTNMTCTIMAPNATSQQIYALSVQATDSTGLDQSNSAQSMVYVNPPLTGVYTSFGGFTDSNDTAYLLIANANGGTLPYKYSWDLINLSVQSGCGINDSVCGVIAANPASPASEILNVTDSAAKPVNVVDWHVVVSLTPNQIVYPGNATTFTAHTTLCIDNNNPCDTGTPASDIAVPTITYAWSVNGGTPSISACSTASNSYTQTCTLNVPSVASQQRYNVKVTVLSANALWTNQSSNPCGGTLISGSNKAHNAIYNCEYSAPASATSKLTVNPPAPLGVTVSESNSLLDAGQTETLTATSTGGGTSNTYTFYTVGTSNTPISGCSGIVSSGATATCTFNAMLGNTNPTTYKYAASVTACGCQTANSAPVSATVYGNLNNSNGNVPTITLSPSNTILDGGQLEVYTIVIKGGIGPFNVELFNMTGSGAQGSNITIAAPGESGTVAFPVSNPGTFKYNAIATDTGTTTPFLFNSVANSIIVNPELQIVSFTASNSVLDIGQITNLTAIISGGMPSYTFNFTVTNSTSHVLVGNLLLTGITSNTASFIYKPTLTGTFNIDVRVTDSAPTPENVFDPLTIVVNPNTTITPVTEAATLSASNTTLDSGQYDTLSAGLLGGIASLYNFSIIDASTNQIILSSGQIPTNQFTFNSAIAGNLTTSLEANVVITDANSLNFASNSIGLTVNPAPIVYVSQGITPITAGSTETYAVTVGGGTGPYTIELYNITGSRQQGSNIVVANPSWQANETVGNQGNESVVLPKGYSLYLCEAAANFTFTSPNPFSWANDTSTGGISSSIGHQTGNICWANTTNSGANGQAIAGIGLNEVPGSYTLYNFSGTQPGEPFSSSVTYTVTNSNSFVVIMINAGFGAPQGPGYPFGPFSTISIPAGCNETLFANNTDHAESAYIATCSGQSPGVYQVSTTGQGGLPVSLAAYVFDSMPTGGSSFSFAAGAGGAFAYNAIATDKGTSSPYTFNSTERSVSVTVPIIDNNAALQLSPSNSVLDSGQSETFTVTATGGVGPFNVELYNVTGSSQQGGNVIIETPGGSNTVTLQVSNPGSFTFNAIATDEGSTSPSANYVFASPSNTIQVNGNVNNINSNVPTVSVTPSSLSIETGKNETFTIQILGGTGPFNIKLYNVTGSQQQGANVIILIPGGTNTITMTTNSIGMFTFNAIATDNGSTAPYTFNSTQLSIEVKAIPTNVVNITNTTNKTITPPGPTPAFTGGGVSTGGAGGGAGGPSKPKIIYEKDGCVVVQDVAVPNSFNFTLGNKDFLVTDNYIGSNYTSVIVNGLTYILDLGKPTSINQSSIYMALTNVSYLPIQQTVDMQACGSQNKTITSINVTANYSPTSLTIKNVTPSSFRNATTLKSTTVFPSLPKDYTGVFVANLTINSSGVRSVNFTVNYECALKANSLQPYVVSAGAWNEITSYSFNTNACTITFTLPGNRTTFGLLTKFIAPKFNPTVNKSTSSSSKYAVTTLPTSPLSEPWPTIVITSGLILLIIGGWRRSVFKGRKPRK